VLVYWLHRYLRLVTLAYPYLKWAALGQYAPGVIHRQVLPTRWYEQAAALDCATPAVAADVAA